MCVYYDRWPMANHQRCGLEFRVLWIKWGPLWVPLPRATNSLGVQDSEHTSHSYLHKAEASPMVHKPPNTLSPKL